MSRKLPILALLFAFLLPLAHADEAGKRAKIDQLFVIMKMNSLMEQMMQAGMSQGEQMGKTLFGGKAMTPEDQKIFDAWKLRVSDLMQNTLSWDKLKPAYIDLYASTYTEEDVDGILAFYKSPAGQHMVAKTPELLTDSQKIVMTRMQAVQPQLQDLMKDLAARFAAAHPDSAPSAKP